MKSELIDHRSGEKKRRKRLERSKRTEKGREIRYIEVNLSKVSLGDAKSVSDLEERHKLFKQAKNELRQFYYSNSRIYDAYHYEIQKRKCLDALCSEERKYITDGSRSKTVMCIVDRGYGVRSKMKGFLKYGGKWKPKRHSLYTSI